MKAKSMTQGSIWKHIILFSIPLLIGNIFQQFYNTVDSIVVGNYVSKEALAAVGSSGPIINMLVGFFMGLSTGASVVISQYFGAKDEQRLKQSVQTSLLMTVGLGLILTIIGIVFAPTLLRFMSTPEDVMPESSLYLRIYFSGLLGLVIYNMASGILRAVGDSRRPLYFLCFSSIINILLDLLFVLVFHMGIEGVAYATIIAQFASAILVVYILIRSQESYALDIKNWLYSQDILKRIFMIGLPAGIQQSITAFSNIFVQGYINAFGSSCMAGWSSYSKIDTFVILPAQSIALASTTFVGQNLGARDIPRAKEGTKISLYISLTTTLILSILLNVGGVTMLKIFSSEQEVIHYGHIFLKCCSPCNVCICMNQIYAGALRGAGDSTAPMVIMLFSFVVFRQILLFIGTKIINSIYFVALSYPMGWIVCSLLMYIYYKKERWLSIFLHAQDTTDTTTLTQD